MSGDGGRRDVGLWTGILAAAVCLALAGAALRGGGGLQTAANWAQIVSLAVALPSLVQVVRLSQRIPPIRAEVAGPAEDVLAAAVAALWRAEAVRRRLDDPDPMPVRWRITGRGEVMDHADNITSGSLLTLSANSAQIRAVVTQFRALRRPRLVFLGDGGTGKTTLAVQLVRELLATRTAEDPVPVLVGLAGWDPQRDGTCTRGWPTGCGGTTRRCARSTGAETSRRASPAGADCCPCSTGWTSCPSPAARPSSSSSTGRRRTSSS
ncbi:hypothetical protein AB0K14_25970 [Actinosynnema sp. NPDC050801]|uniref:hypothetical protein n=1 Tax=unclassified Actinosynnema TaxID=2637065 RepID=UPI0033C96BBC